MIAASNGDVPAGITPLERDIFTSDDFYVDKDLWMDPRYYRCNAPYAIEASWGSYEAPTIGDDPPRTVSWGYCDRDYDRANIVSPYPYKSAQEHYEALKAEAASRGGPTKHTRENPPPDWSGNYAVGFGQFTSTRSWIGARLTQVPTYISLLTPEYQQRMVQQMWHDAHNEVIWPGAFCWPDGLVRRWFGGAGGMYVFNPEIVEISGGANEKIVVDVYVDRMFKTDGSTPYLSTDTRQYNGETIGFWDGEALITWTSNVKGWLAHGWFEYSNEFQTVEVYTPIDDKDGNFVGLMHEAIFYDPVAFVEPVRVVQRLERRSTLPVGNTRTWSQCIPNLFIVDGKQTAASPGDIVQFKVPDMTRPWADAWAESETNMQVPEGEDVLAGFN